MKRSRTIIYFFKSRPMLAKFAVGVALVLGPLRGFQGSSTQITISQVFGLETELLIRPIAGVQFAPGSVAYADKSGFLETVEGPAGNCVTVAGLSIPCPTGSSGGPGSGGMNFADNEVPSGLLNGSNVTFVLTHPPISALSVHLYRNGIRLSNPGDYTVTALTGVITLTVVPAAGDQLVVDYRY